MDAPSVDVPDWLRPLAEAARAVRPQDLSRFLPPDDGSGRPSAVLMAFAETADGPGVLLIERAADMRTHAGQVAFPGGATDPDDPHAVATALREAEEEVGLDPSSVHVVAELPALFLPPSGFVVTPVLAWWTAPHAVAPGRRRRGGPGRGRPGRGAGRPGEPVPGRAPVRLLRSRVRGGRAVRLGFHGRPARPACSALGGWARPWDETRVRPLPPGSSARLPAPPAP